MTPGEPASGDAPAEGTGEGEWSATEAFELLGDETRLAILRALAEPRREGWADAGLAFAELRRAVGERDAGNFSYHLDRLRGVFVTKRDGTYRLTNRGMRLVGAVLASTYTDPGTERRGAVDHDCPYPSCDEGLEAVYSHNYFRIRCPDHRTFHGTMVPPAVADHSSLDELLRIATRESRHDVERARMGVCPHCRGSMDATLPAGDGMIPEDVPGRNVDGALFVGCECHRCGMTLSMPPGAVIADHPAVVSLFHDHGRDLRTEPYATLPFMAPAACDLESERPTRVRVQVACKDDRLDVVLDGDARVVEYERTAVDC